MAADRRLLVSARRDADRRLLAVRRRRPKDCGCPTRACPPTEGEAKLKIAILGAGSVGCFIGGCWQAAGLAVTLHRPPQLRASDIARTWPDAERLQRLAGDPAAGQVDFRSIREALGRCRHHRLERQERRDRGSGAGNRRAWPRRRDRSSASRTASAMSTCCERSLAAGSRSFAEWSPTMSPISATAASTKASPAISMPRTAPKRGRLRRRSATARPRLKLSDDMLGIAWGKLLINLNNAVNALSGRTLLEELQRARLSPRRRGFAARGSAAARAAGIEPAKVGPVAPALLPLVIGSPDWLFNNVFLKAWKIDAKARSSMADDLAAGPQDRGRLSSTANWSRWPSGSARRRRSTAGSSN